MKQIPRHDHPEWGWAALALLVVIVDMTGERTMSDVFRTTVRRPVSGALLMGAWCYMTAHLTGLIPPQYDAFHQLSCYWRSAHA